MCGKVLNTLLNTMNKRLLKISSKNTTILLIAISNVFKLTRNGYLRNSKGIFPNPNPVNTGQKLNVHKTFSRRPWRLLNVLCTFSLRSLSRSTCHNCNFIVIYECNTYFIYFQLPCSYLDSVRLTRDDTIAVWQVCEKWSVYKIRKRLIG